MKKIISVQKISYITVIATRFALPVMIMVVHYLQPLADERRCAQNEYRLRGSKSAATVQNLFASL